MRHAHFCDCENCLGPGVVAEPTRVTKLPPQEWLEPRRRAFHMTVAERLEKEAAA